ncbi:MAG: DUF1049 domain-containing protein [Rhodospirillales bacterium]|nr:MAG: DUF1049 domain-containing protein [Rhodospirillales bacterium]
MIAVPLMVAVPLFAISNLSSVDLKFWPLPFVVQVPVFVIALAGLAVGFFAGGIVAWFSAGRARARARSAERTVRIRDIEIEELRRKMQQAERVSAGIKAEAPTTGLPAPVKAAQSR